jgi:hypothetical protein
MSEKHITDSDEDGLRHFSRHTEKCKKTTSADCKYEDRYVGALSPPTAPTTFPKTGFSRHHIVPVSSVGKFEVLSAYSAEDRDKILKVYKKTKWCTSREENITILPLKAEYVGSSAIHDLNRPCHNLDHGCAQGYTDEVTEAVESQVWSKFQKAVDKKDHPKPKDVAKAIMDIEDDFSTKLEQRGARNKGTSIALSENGKWKTKDEAAPTEWWLPFSMAKDEVAKQRVLLSLGKRPDWLHQQLESRYSRRYCS